MSKHTAGPWVIEKSPFEVYNVDHGALTHQVNSGHTMIAALYAHHESHDARLIAAAPDLLEALLMCCQSMGSVLPDFNSFDQAAYDKARAAIAKATGEDQ